jgi:hypothetical protein
MHLLPCPNTGILPAGLYIWPWKLDFELTTFEMEVKVNRKQ